MRSRYGIESHDYRNTAILVVGMTLLFVFVIDGPLFNRLLAAAITGLVAGFVYLLTTVLLNREGAP